MSNTYGNQPISTEIIPISEVPIDDLFPLPTPVRPIVLVVDDDPLVADTLSAILKGSGYTTLTAYNAVSALELASNIQPNILLSDIHMPGMNGVALALLLVTSIPACKVIFCSGHATVADLDPVYKAGYSFPLLMKPVHPSEMLEYLANCREQPHQLAHANNSVTRSSDIYIRAQRRA